MGLILVLRFHSGKQGITNVLMRVPKAKLVRLNCLLQLDRILKTT